MKSRIIISENEKKEILKLYNISENNPASQLNEQKSKVVIGKGKDPYNYKLDDKNNFYYIKKTDYEKNPNAWVLVKDPNAKEQIKNVYFAPFTGGKQVSPPQSEGEIRKFQEWVINVKKDKNILGSFGADGKWGGKSQAAWNKYGNEFNATFKSKTDKLSGNGYPYDNLKKNPTPSLIAKIIKSSKGSGMFSNDKEAWAEAAFISIPSKDVYNQVSKLIGEDPYYFVKNFMDTSQVYHQKSIDNSMKRIVPNFKMVGSYSRDTDNKNRRTEAGILSGFKTWFRRTFPNVAEMFFARDLKSSDFNSSQKQEIIDAVGRAINRTGQKKGSIEYVDYGDNVVNKWFGPGGVGTTDMITNTALSNPKFMVATTLGRFSYDLNGNKLHITDIYDFSKIEAIKTTPQELEGLTYPQKVAKVIKDNNVNPYLAVRHIAYLEHPDTDPKSKPKIDIQLELA